MTEESIRTTERQAADGLASSDARGMLSGLSVIESGTTSEYAVCCLPGLGRRSSRSSRSENAYAVWPRSETNKGDKEQSLYVWAYNRGKRPVVLDLVRMTESGDAETAGGR